MSKETVKTQIDTDITNKTTSKSISPLNVGNNMKAVVDLIPIVDGSETKLTPGNNIVITGDGTISFPYVINNVTVDLRPYKVYTALLSQSGTSAPVATVLENTLGGAVVWSRIGVGAYRATLSGVFTATKSFGQAALYTDINTVYSGNRTFQFNRNTTSIMELFHTRNDTNVDNFAASVEIRVYN